MNRLTAALYDPMFARVEEAGLSALRASLLADVAGEVLEIGAGTGLNLAHYRDRVSRLVLAEPNRHMRSRLEPRAPRGATILDASAESLPVPDASFDVVVSTLVMCSVASVERTLAEARRVLRPGGRLVFIEHGAAEDPAVERWQRRVEPFWTWVTGCRITLRQVDAMIAAGFEMETTERMNLKKMLPLLRPATRGAARKP